MYILRTRLESGKDYESVPEIAEFDNSTESRLVLYAVRDALNHMNYACNIVIHTECDYVAAAINRHWPEEWRKNGWKNSKDKEAKDAVLWSMILEELEESGHELTAEKGKHEWTEWMRWNMPLAAPLRDIFKKTRREP